MVNLRNFFGLKRVFGIISTYEEWRICWLSDSDDAARETSVESYVQHAREASSCDIADHRIVHASPILRHDNPDLIRLLVHLMHKMHLSPYDTSPKLVKSGQRYPLFNEEAWDWTPLDSDFRLSYCMPNANTSHFYLLQQYHGGADGLVWLAASYKGNLVVLKFGLVGGSRRSMQDLLESEARYWTMLWGVRVRVVKLFHRLALVMPFAFHAHLSAPKAVAAAPQVAKGDRLAAQRFITFKGPNSWTAILPDAEVAKRAASAKQPDPDVVREDNEVMPLLANFLQQHPPESIARDAIGAMLRHDVMHADLRWRHVAILPFRSGSQWMLKPILIDLTRVRRIHTSNKPKVAAVDDGDRSESDNEESSGSDRAPRASASEEDKAAELKVAMEQLADEFENGE